MRRKVIQLAGKTNLISLPISWVKKYNIKKSDELEITENGDNLTVNSKLEKTSLKITIDITSFSEMSIRYALSAIHKMGYDEITLLYNSSKQVEIIQDMVKNLLLGFIIIDQNQKKIVLKSVTSDIDKEFDPTLRRAFLVSLSLTDSSLEMIKHGNFAELKSLISLEKTNNQLTSFCLRLISKGVYNDTRTIHLMSTIIWDLEKIVDEYKYICVYLSNCDTKISLKLIDVYLLINNFLKEYYNLFYKFDLVKLNELSDQRYLILKMIQQIKTNDKFERYLLIHLSAVLSKIVDLSSSIFGVRHLSLNFVKVD